MHLNMWSGPRNMSTALMHAFAARPDFIAWDEPFYAAYLDRTGLDHPMRDQILAACETDPDSIAAACLSEPPNGAPHSYLKQMAHHMIPGFPLDFAASCRNVHLIRHPARVIASYRKKRGAFTATDLGYHRHVEIFDRFPGPVIDSDDIRREPEAVLTRLCTELDLEFSPAMLNWPDDVGQYDGVWSDHWYDAVTASRGLTPSDPGPLPALDDDAALLDALMPIYDTMARNRL